MKKFTLKTGRGEAAALTTKNHQQRRGRETMKNITVEYGVYSGYRLESGIEANDWFKDEEEAMDYAKKLAEEEEVAFVLRFENGELVSEDWKFALEDGEVEQQFIGDRHCVFF